MPTAEMEALKQRLKTLGLVKAIEILDELSHKAAKAKWSYSEFFSRLMEEEYLAKGNGAKIIKLRKPNSLISSYWPTSTSKPNRP